MVSSLLGMGVVERPTYCHGAEMGFKWPAVVLKV
jgi:hypothetical protein